MTSRRPLLITPLPPPPPPLGPEPLAARVATARAGVRVRVYVTDGAMHAAWRAVAGDHDGGNPGAAGLRERGGALVGRYAASPAGHRFIVVADALAAPAAPASRCHIEIRAEDWHDIHRRLAARPGWRLLGWFHSHPGLGVRMSRIDRRTQRRLFGADWQVGLVVDPLSGDTRFYQGAAAAPPRWLAFVGDDPAPDGAGREPS